ncbi:hypothetical protein C8J56DRAFT_1170041 [Mycena floridula]|nr:hypothetical protein C8J56DRAFT_1170041 [Mycena floridula]
MLPEELLSAIVAFIPESPELYSHFSLGSSPSYYDQQRSASLWSLSLVNQQFRRICMPFLFSYVKCDNLEDVISLRDEWLAKAPFIANIRTLQVLNCDTFSAPACAFLVELLPSLSSLVCLDINAMKIDAALLSTINHHPSLSKVLVSVVVPLFGLSPLSKIIHKSVRMTGSPPFRSHFDKCIKLGLGIGYLALFGNIANDPTQGQVIMGLRNVSISLWQGLHKQRLLWLEGFVARHPDLKTLRFSNFQGQGQYLCLHSPHTPFVSRFIDDLRELGMLDTEETLTQFMIAQPYTSKSVNLNQWIVAGISLITNKATIEIIKLAHLSFPHLTSLSLDIDETNIDIHELTAAVSGFRSLRVLDLDHLCRNLDFGADLPPQNHPDEARYIEFALKWYAEHLARACSSIERIFVSEAGPETAWMLRGQYTVTRRLLADGGGIHLAGSVKIHRASLPSSFTVTETGAQSRTTIPTADGW